MADDWKHVYVLVLYHSCIILYLFVSIVLVGVVFLMFWFYNVLHVCIFDFQPLCFFSHIDSCFSTVLKPQIRSACSPDEVPIGKGLIVRQPFAGLNI